MIYLFDASALIRSNAHYYPMSRFYQIWDWFELKATEGYIKVPYEILQEINTDNDPLTVWTKQIRKKIEIRESVDQQQIEKILDIGYQFNGIKPNLNDLNHIGRDPFLIYYALKDIKNRTIVSFENSEPDKKRRKSKIPNVCSIMGVCHCYMKTLFEELDFQEK